MARLFRNLPLRLLRDFPLFGKSCPEAVGAEP